MIFALHLLSFLVLSAFSPLISRGALIEESTPAPEGMDYFLFRNVVNSICNSSIPSGPANEKHDLTRRTETDGAVPFWLENGIPHIVVAVGNPPQLDELNVDTGSGFTWIHRAAQKECEPRYSSV